MNKPRLIGIDLFSGAGGMSTGAIRAGIDVKLAVEIDKYAAFTFMKNHSSTRMLNHDIRKLKVGEYLDAKKKDVKILFGGPPCQGFSTANQKTRNKNNSHNWLFQEFIRTAKECSPEWVIVENVKGLVETENGFFFEQILSNLKKIGYKTSYAILNASDFGVPQIRSRIFIVGSKQGISYKFPSPTTKSPLSVNDAISDLPLLMNGADYSELDYVSQPKTEYQKRLREKSPKSFNNHVTKSNDVVVERYRHIPQGGNWENIPAKLMGNYQDFSRCHTRIYHRLKDDQPSVVLGNYRKNMLVHPYQHRGLSVREAARLQSFPDEFKFHGSIGFQQQQVGNAVPPLLSYNLFKQLIKLYC